MKLLFLSILIFLFANTFAQEVVVDNFSAGSNLASSYTTQVLEDQENYIWVSTDNGVTRFDGYRFQNFDISDGLPENDIVRMFMDKQNTIWFLSQSGLVSYFSNEKIHTFPFNNKISEILNDYDIIEPRSLYVSNNSIEFNIRENGRYLIDSLGQISTIYSLSDSINTIDMRTDDEKYFFSSKNTKLKLIFENKILLIKSPNISKTEAVLVKHNKTTVFISSQNNLFFIKEKKTQTLSFEKTIKSLDIDIQGNLWVGFESGGILCYENAEVEKPNHQELRTESVSSIIRDRQNSIWVSTTNEGLYYIPSLEFKKVTTDEGLVDNNITRLDFSNNYLWAITGNNSIARIYYNNIKNYKFDNPDFTSVTDIYWYNQKLWVSFKNKISYFKGEELVDLFRLDNNYGNHSRINRISSGVGTDLWLSKSDGFAQIKNNKLIFESNSQNFQHLNVNSTFTEPNGDLWLACKNGLWKFENNKLFNYNEKNDLLSKNIIDIIKDDKTGALWMAVNDKGIVKVLNDSIWLISEKDGLISNTVTSIFLQGDNLWVGTRKGLSKIDILNPDFESAIINITRNDGLITNEINDVIANEELLFVATNRGLGFFNHKKFKLNTTVPDVKIIGIRVEGELLEHLSKKINIDYYSNNISIDFKANHIRSRSKIEYRFRIKELDKEWNYTYNRIANYPFLPSGKHTFQVEASNSQGEWSLLPKELQINIGNPFWLEWWFFIIILLVLILFINIWYKYLIQIRSRKEKINNEINQYKQMALTRQMNPHFIFNALNSIQHYILQNDIRLSNKFLTKFSKLIRLILDNSQETLITLDKELLALNLYLELEQLRFKEKMQYKIEISPEIDIFSIKIPPMLIQPFVENAIWHGIMNKVKGQGLLNIEFLSKDNKVICTIDDNGIGRDKASQINQQRNSTHQSMGTLITTDRIELINKIYKKEISVEYTDVKDKLNQPLGTNVTIIF